MGGYKKLLDLYGQIIDTVVIVEIRLRQAAPRKLAGRLFRGASHGRYRQTVPWASKARKENPQAR